MVRFTRGFSGRRERTASLSGELPQGLPRRPPRRAGRRGPLLGEASTGASNDPAGATSLALRMVWEWGLSDRVGPVGYTSDGPGYRGEAGLTSRPYAEDTQRAIDEEVAELLRNAEAQATELLSTHRAHIDRVVAQLLDKETIAGADLLAIIGDDSTPRATEGRLAPTIESVDR